MERKINEIFTDSNGERVICVEAIYEGSCEGCIYRTCPSGCIDMNTLGSCRRDDGDVIFKRADNYLE